MGWIMLGANLPISYPICYPLSWLRALKWGRCKFSIMSHPEEPGKPWRASRIVQWALLYLVFVTPINVRGEWAAPEESMRFWDLPWFFALMCLIAGVYRHGLMRELPATRAATEATANPKLQPIPTAR